MKMELAYIPEEPNKPAPDTNIDYVEQMKTVYTVDPETLDKVDWVLLFAGGVGTIIATIAIVWWFVTLLLFLLRVSLGKRTINDKRFWMNMSGIFIVLCLFTSGAIFLFISHFYDLLEAWGKL